MTLPLAAVGRRISAAACPASARYFLPRGCLGSLIDGDRAAMLSHYVEGKARRCFKSPYRPVLGDLAYTEKVIFG